MFPDPVSRQTPDVIRILYEFRRAVELKELGMLDEMASRWLMIENRLDADITALAYELQKLKDEGKIVGESVVLKSQRYKALREQIQREIEKYNRDYAVGMIADQQAAYAKIGIDAAQTAMRSAMGTIGYNFNLINIDAVMNMIGFAGNGSPLYTLLQKDYGDAVSGLTNALINGIARGYGPVKTAREMANGFGMGLDRAILIARTETIRSYRTATTEQYRASGAVTGFRRLVWKPTACLGCLMRDGEFFEVEEELTDHPAGKCTAIASIRGVKDVQWETGKQWFNKLSPEEQRAKMGAEKYQLWKDGKFKLEDLSKLQHSTVWGDSPRVATISELLGGATSKKDIWINSLTDKEKQAIHHWGISGGDLRRLQSGDTARMSEFELIEAKRTLPYWESATAKGVKYEGEIYRGLTNVPYNGVIDQWTPGSIIKLTNDQSATYGKDIAKDFVVIAKGDNRYSSVLWKIDQSSGINLFEQTNVTMGGKLISESEIIIKKNTQYRIKSNRFFKENGKEFSNDYFEGTEFSWPDNPPPNWYPSKDFLGYYEITLEEI